MLDTKLNITWIDNNHANVVDRRNGREFNITVREKAKKWVRDHRVKSRLYVGGQVVQDWEDNPLSTHTQAIKHVKEYFGPTLQAMLGENIGMKFSSTAGCFCGCSPGFILENSGELLWDVWMDAV
jgi:hypothetical protein